MPSSVLATKDALKPQTALNKKGTYNTFYRLATMVFLVISPTVSTLVICILLALAMIYYVIKKKYGRCFRPSNRCSLIFREGPMDPLRGPPDGDLQEGPGALSTDH